MATVTIPREVTSDEMTEVLREGLEPYYNVVPGMRVNNNPLGRPRPGHPDTILVGTGANTWTRAQVRIISGPQRTEIRITPGGLLGERLVNTFKLGHKIRQAILDAPGLQAN